MPVLLIAVLLFGIAVPVLKFNIIENTSTGRIQLCYDGAYKGITPVGTRMNIYRIASKDFLGKILDVLGENAGELTEDALSKRIFISPYTPLSSDENAYVATVYTVRVYPDMANPAPTAKEILDAVIIVFFDEFASKYSTDDLSRFDVDRDALKELEYFDILELMRDKVSMLDTYLDAMTKVGSQSGKDSSAFASLRLRTQAFSRSMLDGFEIFLENNHVFRDAGTFQFKERYEALENYREYSSNYLKYKAGESIVNNYDPIMITYVFEPLHSEEEGLYMSRTDTGIDFFTGDMKDYFSLYSENLAELDRISENLKLSFGSEQFLKEKQNRCFDIRKFDVKKLAESGKLLSEKLPVTPSSETDLATADAMLGKLLEQYTLILEQLHETVKEYNTDKGINAISCEVIENTSPVKQLTPELIFCGVCVLFSVLGFAWRRSLKAKEAES